MKATSIPFIVLIALAFAGAGITAAGAQAGEDPASVAAGQEIFATNCAGCHGASGEGSNAGRPLTGIAGQQPDRTVHIASVTNGTEGGMPAFGTRLSEEEIDNVVAYVRGTFVVQSDDELPNTGAETQLVLLAGVTLMLIGLALVRTSGRSTRITA